LRSSVLTALCVNVGYVPAQPQVEPCYLELTVLMSICKHVCYCPRTARQSKMLVKTARRGKLWETSRTAQSLL